MTIDEFVQHAIDLHIVTLSLEGGDVTLKYKYHRHVPVIPKSESSPQVAESASVQADDTLTVQADARARLTDRPDLDELPPFPRDIDTVSWVEREPE